MEKQYQKLHFLATRQTLFPKNCLPPKKGQLNQRDSLLQLLKMNESIRSLIDHKEKHSKRDINPQSNIIDFELTKDRKTARKRIHHNFLGLKPIRKQSSEENQSKQRVNQDGQKKTKRHYSTKLMRDKLQKEQFEQEIQKYLNKSQQSKILENYLSNRQEFIRKACEDISQELIEKLQPVEMKGEVKSLTISPKKHIRAKSTLLPELPQNKKIKKHSASSIGAATLVIELNQIKKALQIDQKNRTKAQMLFRKKLKLKENKLNMSREKLQCVQ